MVGVIISYLRDMPPPVCELCGDALLSSLTGVEVEAIRAHLLSIAEGGLLTLSKAPAGAASQVVQAHVSLHSRLCRVCKKASRTPALVFLNLWLQLYGVP